MKTLIITSSIAVIFCLTGCAITESQDFKNDLCLVGLMCLFTLMYASHIFGLSNQGQDEGK